MTYAVISLNLIDSFVYRHELLGAVCAHFHLCDPITSLDHGGALQYSHVQSVEEWLGTSIKRFIH